MAIAFNKPLVCPVLIGRTTELAALRLLMDQAKSDQGQVALLSGEAGIGKSRLVVEIKTYAASHDFLHLQGSCFPTDLLYPFFGHTVGDGWKQTTPTAQRNSM